MDREALGPAENIIRTLLSFTDHMTHSRPGVIFQDSSTVTGTKWVQANHRVINDEKVVFMQTRGKNKGGTRVGVLQNDNSIVENGRVVAHYRSPSLNKKLGNLYPEVAVYLYEQIVSIWELDNKLAAQWASFAYKSDNSTKDLKVLLAAFMLVQSRKGDPIVEDGKFQFSDDDFREVGEAMCLIPPEKKKSSGAFDARLIHRVWQVLNLPGIIQINRRLGFSQSSRQPFLGRWEKAAQKWLRYREENIEMLEGLVKSGQSEIVKNIARHCHYKPLSEKFFDVLRWEQSQSKLGHRGINIGKKKKAADNWSSLSEVEICQKIVNEKISYARLVGLLPKEKPLTRSMIAAAIEIGGVPAKNMIILTPTLEKFGLLEDPDVKKAWEAAVKKTNDMRGANIASRVKSKEVAEKLNEAAENAVKKAVEKAMGKSIRVYWIVDKSASMDDALERAKHFIKKFFGAFDVDQTHVTVFNSYGTVLSIKKGNSAGVENAFKGIRASGGTDYGQGVLSLSQFKPKDDEDSLFIFIGDEEQGGNFAQHVRQSGLRPVAFGLIRVLSESWKRHYGAQYGRGVIVQETARVLGIPCFMIDEKTFDDTYAIPQTLRTLIESTPVSARATTSAVPRKSLIDQIMETELLSNPAWAA